MSDETDDDAPDIPPALTAEEWRFGKAAVRDLTIRVDSASLVIQTSDDTEPRGRMSTHVLNDVKDLAAVIALANEMLRRFDDPRAVLREHVGALRVAADRIEHAYDSFLDEFERKERIGLPVSDDARQAAEKERRAMDLLHELADAWESYLPPDSAH